MFYGPQIEGNTIPLDRGSHGLQLQYWSHLDGPRSFSWIFYLGDVGHSSPEFSPLFGPVFVISPTRPLSILKRYSERQAL